MKQFIKARAAWIEGCTLRHDVVLCIENGVFTDILSPRQVLLDPTQVVVCEEELVLPGFINSHCHLEYSFCRGKLPRGPVPFDEWIEAIGALKRTATADEIVSAARSALKELYAGGCTTLIDCAHRKEIALLLGESALRHVILWELIALSDDQADAVWADAMEILSQARPPRALCYGLNPHAPYSVGSRLRQYLREFSVTHSEVPIGWHVAETAEEVEFFAFGTGPFAAFCERHALPLVFEEVPGCSPLMFLKQEKLLCSADYLFHFNYFTKEDVQNLCPHHVIVHCPTTHSFFQRKEVDLVQLVKKGCNVVLGTDSLATADTLSMLEVVKMVGQRFPSLTGSQLLDMVTKGPAKSKALKNVSPPLGRIEKGYAADFVALQTPLPLALDSRDLLLHPETKIVATYVAGEKVF